ncbi:MAG: DUF5610 domain-containing protein [Bdellovibrionales bacterium]|nr:DUF5610 domain-containing protein [Bdellovibrionales bacterium]
MEGSQSLIPNGTPVPQALSNITKNTGQLQADKYVIDSSLRFEQEPAAKVSFSPLDLPTSLTISAEEVLQKLNELLSDKLPEGIESLRPEEHTPEATADRIVQGATAFFDIYAQQNPDLEGEELLNSFMSTIRSGIETGYNDAFKTLEGIGAFELDGIQAGIEETKTLIEEKLVAYEAQKRVDLGLEPLKVKEEVEEKVSHEVLAQSGRIVVDRIV